MTENMNRFDFNTEGKICDYGEEEPKVLSEQEILEELNRLDQANYELLSENTSVNWTNECLQEQVDTYVKLLACKDIYENKIADLEEKLAEKEKEIKKLKEVVDCVDKLKQFNVDMKDYALVNRDVADEIYREHQAKTDFAIEQLEKVKEILLENLYDLYSKPSEIWDKYGDLYDVVVEGAVNGTIDNQIKELKEGK